MIERPYVGQVVALVGSGAEKYVGQQFDVVKINPKSIRLKSRNTGAFVKAFPEHLVPVALEDIETITAPAAKFFMPGATVQFKQGLAPKGYSDETVFVVLRQREADFASIAVLGGKSNGEYWPNVRSHNLSSITLHWEA